jgi:hypothetical protein
MTPEVLSWIDEQKPALVGAAERYIQDNPIYAPDPGRREARRPPARVSGSQLRNLVNAAQTGSPLAVMVNLLRYQIGRGGRGWKDKDSGQALERVLVSEVKTRAESAPGSDEGVRYAVESRLAALLLGYIVREFTYRCELAGTSHD